MYVSISVPARLLSPAVYVSISVPARLLSPAVYVSISVPARLLSPAVYVSISGSGDQLVGQDYSLTCQVNAGGETVTPEYQWIKDGTEIRDETSATLSFSSLADTDSGDYTCRVTVGNQTSNASVTIVTVEGKCKSQLCNVCM